jgi:hypothetical protein
MPQDKNASETRTFNFLEAPVKMERVYLEISAPYYKLRKAGPDLERQEESPRLCKEETLVPESCISLPRDEKKLSLNK